MTRDEYYKSSEFIVGRLLNNTVAGLVQDVQRLYDILEIYGEKHPQMAFSDRYSLFERQLRLVHSELSRLQEYETRLAQQARPELED